MIPYRPPYGFPAVTLDLDHWLPDPGLRIVHCRRSGVDRERLWEAARAVRVADTSLLGRLVRWRIPGTPPQETFDELFRRAPFMVLEEHESALVSGLVGRIWTLRRDYPQLRNPEEYLGWRRRGTARVLFAHWVEDVDRHGATMTIEVRVEAFGVQGRLGVRAVRPLVRRFHALVGSDGIEAAVRLAERR